MTVKFSLDKDKIKVLLLEGVHPNTVETFRAAGYTNVEYLKTSLSEEELIERIRDVHFVGLRSRTQITEKVLDAATKLVAIGRFCIGTNQVSSTPPTCAASPSSTPLLQHPLRGRTGTGEICCCCAAFPRRTPGAIAAFWEKLANRSVEAQRQEARHHRLRPSAPSLASSPEMIGMKVYYYDIENKLSLGNAIRVPNLVELLNMSDVISLHVPETASTKDLIGAEQLRMMKPRAPSSSTPPAAPWWTSTPWPTSSRAATSPAPPSTSSRWSPSPTTRVPHPAARPGQRSPDPHIRRLHPGSPGEHRSGSGQQAGQILRQRLHLSAVNFPEVSLPGHKGLQPPAAHSPQPARRDEPDQPDLRRRGDQHRRSVPADQQRIGYVVIDVETEHSEKAWPVSKINGTIRARILHLISPLSAQQKARRDDGLFMSGERLLSQPTTSPAGCGHQGPLPRALRARAMKTAAEPRSGAAPRVRDARSRCDPPPPPWRS